MVMIRAIIRPEMVEGTLKALADAGHPAVTKIEVYGRGKQKGLQVGSVFYDELPKEMLIIVVDDAEEEKVSSIIIEAARTGDGNFGDGRIFVTPIKKAYTISSMKEGL
jgi:nitrogen regulatory protein PII 1